MELSHRSNEGDPRQDKQDKDKNRRFTPINPVTRKAVRDWLSPAEVSPKSPPEPEHRMPVSVVAPEITPAMQPHTMPHEAALHSEAWLGAAVRPPEYQAVVAPVIQEFAKDDKDEGKTAEKKDNEPIQEVPTQPQTETHDRQEPSAPIHAEGATYPVAAEVSPSAAAEDDAFERLLQRAGLNELSRSLEQPSATPVIEPAPTETHDRQEPSAPIAETPSSATSEAPTTQPATPGGGEGQPPAPYTNTEGGGPFEHNEQPFATAAPAGAVRMPAAEQQRDVDQSEYILRSQARTRALVAFAAGLIIGNHFGKKRVRRELTKTLEEVKEKMAENEAQHDYTQAQAERQTYNDTYWQRRVNRPDQPPTPEQMPVPTAASGEQEQVAAEDPFNLQPEEHVERDAWHSIVVDKYGHEDVAARQQYGKAFEQEQREVQKSALSDDTPTSHGTNDAGGVSATSAPMSTSSHQAPRQAQPPAPFSVPSVTSLPDGLTEPQLPSGVPTRKDSQHLLPAHAKVGASLLLNPWVWLFIGLLFLVFFGASLFG